jgi:hypothetical protein
MSDINTNGMNINYPVPGINNSSQGFRDNFGSIKTNLDITKDELSDLQSKVLVKSALNGTTLNNDMAGGQISNVETKTYRKSSYHLGSALEGVIVIDVTKGDVQYGTVSGPVTIYFDNWPSTTGNKVVQTEIQIRLIVEEGSVITFPPSTHDTDTGELLSGPTTSAQQLENFGSQYLAPGVFSNQIGVPNGVTLLVYNVSSIDCGTTLDIYPVNRNQKAGGLQLRTIADAVGLPGDGPGTICSDGQYLYLCVGNYDGESPIWGRMPLYVIP